MTNLTNFNNFELSTEETTNVNGGWGCRRRRRSYSSCSYSYSSYSYNNCSYSYNNCYTSCDSATEEVKVEEAAPVIEAVIETPAPVQEPRGTAGL